MSEINTQKPNTPLINNSEQLSTFTDPECTLCGVILYHGSAQSGIGELLPGQDEDSMPATLGEGLYFTTDAQSASDYARLRLHSKRGEAPTLYQVRTSDNLLMANLDNADKREECFYSFQKYLRGVQPKGMLEIIRVSAAVQSMARMEARLGPTGLGHAIAGGVSYLFGDFMKTQGYDGLIMTEGGEGRGDIHVGSHRTVVIFDPSKVRIEAERRITVAPTHE